MRFFPARLTRLGLLLLAMTLCCAAGQLAAQEPGEQLAVVEDTSIVQQVELRDGTTFTGRVVSIDGEWVTFVTVKGVEVRFRREDVASVRELSRAEAAARGWPRDGNDSRLFLSPTARVPEHLHGYFGVYELFFPSAGVGLGGVAMVTGGVSIVPGIAIDEQVFYLSGKLRFLNVDYVQAAAGVFWVHAGSTDESAGAVLGTVTAGSDIAAFTGSIAFPFATASGFESKPLIALGGEYRVSRKIKFITENWIVPGEDGVILSFGIRFIGESLTGELAGVVPTTSDDLYVFPLASFAYTW